MSSYMWTIKIKACNKTLEMFQPKAWFHQQKTKQGKALIGITKEQTLLKYASGVNVHFLKEVQILRWPAAAAGLEGSAQA